MPLESGTEIQDLNPSWPLGTDPQSEGDDHIRLTKECIQGSFPGMSAPWVTSNEVFCAPGSVPAAVATVAQLPTQSWGWVDPVGVIEGGSGDFTVARLNEGGYLVTFTDAAPGQYAQAFSAQAQGLANFSGDYTVSVYPRSATECEVGIVRGSNGSATDQAFTFTRIIA